jgi:predicted esterase
MKKIVFLIIFIFLFCTYFIWKNKERVRNDYQKKDSTKVESKIQENSIKSIFEPNQPVKFLDSLEEKPLIPRNDNLIHSWIATKKFSYPTDSFKAYIFNGMPFRLAYPNNYKKGLKKYPIIFILHGKGEMGDAYDNESQLFNGGRFHLKALQDGKYEGFILYPQIPGAWFDAYYEKLDLLLNGLIKSLDIDENRVVVHGLSLGGNGVLGWAISSPKSIAAIMPMSAVGGWDDFDNLKYIPIWAFQGKRDVLPTYTYTEYEVNRLLAKGANIRYTLYEKAGHNSWDRAYREKDFFPFINSAHKANPVAYANNTFLSSNTSIAITPGFDGYEWRKDGQILNGENNHILKIKAKGKYDARILRDSVWSTWSLKPVVIR